MPAGLLRWPSAKLDRKPDTPAKLCPWAWTLLASQPYTSSSHLPEQSHPSLSPWSSSPRSFGHILQVSAGYLHLWTSPQGWVNCSPLWFHQFLILVNCHCLFILPARLWARDLTWFVVFPHLVESLAHCGYPINRVEWNGFGTQNPWTYNLKESE